jgi:hypothetical protein
VAFGKPLYLGISSEKVEGRGLVCRIGGPA